MNWITTNIRLPEDDYRERLGIKKPITNKKELSERLENFAKATAGKHPGVSLSQKLIEMRYEQ